MDPESGLFVIKDDEEDKNVALNNIFYDLENKYADYSVNGQYKFKNYNVSVLENPHVQYSTKYPEILLDIDENTKKIIFSQFIINI